MFETTHIPLTATITAMNIVGFDAAIFIQLLIDRNYDNDLIIKALKTLVERSRLQRNQYSESHSDDQPYGLRVFTATFILNKASLSIARLQPKLSRTKP